MDSNNFVVSGVKEPYHLTTGTMGVSVRWRIRVRVIEVSGCELTGLDTPLESASVKAATHFPDIDAKEINHDSRI